MIGPLMSGQPRLKELESSPKPTCGERRELPIRIIEAGGLASTLRLNPDR